MMMRMRRRKKRLTMSIKKEKGRLKKKVI